MPDIEPGTSGFSTGSFQNFLIFNAVYIVSHMMKDTTWQTESFLPLFFMGGAGLGSGEGGIRIRSNRMGADSHMFYNR